MPRAAACVRACVRPSSTHAGKVTCGMHQPHSIKRAAHMHCMRRATCVAAIAMCGRGAVRCDCDARGRPYHIHRAHEVGVGVHEHLEDVERAEVARVDEDHLQRGSRVFIESAA